jgi:flagellar M-ring protein FliF
MPFVQVMGSDAELEQDFLGLSKADLMRIAELLVLGLVAVLVLLLVVRPLLGRLLAVDEESIGEEGAGLLPDGSPQPALIGPDGQQVPRLAGDGGTTVATRIGDDGASEKNVANEIDQMIDLNQVEGRVRASSVKKIGEIIEKHPEEAVAIIRGWLHADA